MKRYLLVLLVAVFSFIITACPGGGNNVKEGFELEAKDVEITINPASLNMESQQVRLEIAETEVKIKRQGGFTGEVFLRVTAKPDNVASTQFVPNNTLGNKSILKLGINPVKPVGGYQIVIEGKSDDKFATTKFDLVIKQAPDTTKPKVLDVKPHAFEKGVKTDTKIVFKFSEPMDKESTEKAFYGEKFGPLKYAWSDNDKTLTITPIKGFSYSDTDRAKAYVFLLETSASDKAGNKLDKETKVTFYTPRTLSTEIYSQKDLDGYVTNASGGIAVTQGEYVEIGDIDSNAYVRGFVSFKIKALPDDLVSIKKAELSMYQKIVLGKPYTELSLKNMHLRIAHIYYGKSLKPSDLTKPLLDKNFKEFSETSLLEQKTINLTSWVQDDFDNRGVRSYSSQFRLQFPIKTDNDDNSDMVAFYAGDLANEPNLKSKTPILRVWYYAP